MIWEFLQSPGAIGVIAFLCGLFAGTRSEQRYRKAKVRKQAATPAPPKVIPGQRWKLPGGVLIDIRKTEGATSFAWVPSMEKCIWYHHNDLEDAELVQF